MSGRAYLRVLPDLYARKVLGEGSRHPRYTGDQLAAFMGVLTLAETQPARGRFRSVRLLTVLLEGADPDRHSRAIARQIGFLVEQGDLVRQDDGSLYVDGWDEMQEGNLVVAERMRCYRSRNAPVAAPEPSPLPGRITLGTQTVTEPDIRPLARVAREVAVSGEAVSGGGGPRAGAREGTDPIDAYFVKTNRVPRGGALDFLNRLAGEYGDPLLCESLAAVDADPIKDFLSRVELRLTHVLEGAKAAPPNGRATALTPEQDAEARRMVAEQTGVTPESIAAGRAAMAALPRGRTRGLSRIGGEA